MYDDAVRLMKSKDLKAFDLKEESESTRESYGSDNFVRVFFLQEDW